MSYSFSVAAASKADAVAKVAAAFDQVVASQPTHAADKEAAVAAAGAFIDLLQDPGEGEQIAVNMYGSLGWKQSDAPPTSFISGNVSVSASVSKA